MYIRKPPNEMTLKDDFMFSAVMMKPENCKPMLERISSSVILILLRKDCSSTRSDSGAWKMVRS